MAIVDPGERRQAGKESWKSATGLDAAEPKTLLDVSRLDFVHADIWTRPGLSLRDRLLISLSGCANEHDAQGCHDYARGALTGNHLSAAELREAVLQLVVYSGWGTGRLLDNAVTDVFAELGIPEPEVPPLETGPIDYDARIETGKTTFEKVAAIPPPPPFSPFIETGILSFVMSEVWNRAGLDQRARRIITLVGAGFSSSVTPMKSHAYGALATGDLDAAEMMEFLLHFAIHGGWARAAAYQQVIMQQAARVKDGLPFEP